MIRKRIFEREHCETGDFYESFEHPTTKLIGKIIRYAFYTLILICLTAHFWIKQMWDSLSDQPFEEYEVIFLLYDLIIVHCAILYYVCCLRQRRVWINH